MAEMLDRMSSRELAEWRAYDRMEPIGEPRADFRLAVLTSILANANRDVSKKPEPFGPADFAWRGPDALVKPMTERERQQSLMQRVVASLSRFRRKEN